MKKIILSIDGMTCSACSNGLEKYLNKQEGVQTASVNLVMANATIEYDEKKLNQVKLEEFVKQAGFKSLGEFKEINVEKTNKKEKIAIIVFSVLAVILMYISMGHMINLPTIGFLNPHINPINYTVTLCLLSIVFLIYGYDILKNGYKNLIHKTPNMDTLVGIGVISSFVYSIYAMYMIFKGNHNHVMDLYFESTAIVIYFIKLGRYIDGISTDRTKEAIQKLVKITPKTAVIKIGHTEKTVTLDEIKKGDIVVVKPGEKIAVDGKIILGKAHLDESFITGESKPVAKKEGDTVIAGSINYDGYVEYKAERIGKESTISEIVRAVVEASNTKAPIAKVADTVSGYFVPTVIIIAILTLIVYLLIGQSFSVALSTFVTILVIACPCSLGLATPLAIIVSEGLCASNGILVKKSAILENAQKVDTIVFDKTGTLTYGKLKIAEIMNYSNIDETKLLQIVGSIESKSTHPIGKAFENYLEENKIKKLSVNQFENVVGLGIVGSVIDSKDKTDENNSKQTGLGNGENNSKQAGLGNDENNPIQDGSENDKKCKKIILGNSKILEKYGIKNSHIKDEETLSKKGCSIIYVADEENVLALIGVNDIVRENAKEVISILNNNNIQTIMLTGDNKQTAENIASNIGITKVISNVMPKQKVDTIKNLKQENKYVIMCGDGINDSPALATADIGVSVNSGTDIAMDSSDVILTRNNLLAICNLITISKKTIRNIKQNLFWAFFYNCLMIPIAMGVLKPFGISINPMIASLAMVFSSITVILNASRLKNIKMNDGKI